MELGWEFQKNETEEEGKANVNVYYQVVTAWATELDHNILLRSLKNATQIIYLRDGKVKHLSINSHPPLLRDCWLCTCECLLKFVRKASYFLSLFQICFPVYEYVGLNVYKADPTVFFIINKTSARNEHRLNVRSYYMFSAFELVNRCFVQVLEWWIPDQVGPELDFWWVEMQSTGRLIFCMAGWGESWAGGLSVLIWFRNQISNYQ